MSAYIGHGLRRGWCYEKNNLDFECYNFLPLRKGNEKEEDGLVTSLPFMIRKQTK